MKTRNTDRRHAMAQEESDCILLAIGFLRRFWIIIHFKQNINWHFAMYLSNS